MDLRVLHYFLTVAREQSFTKAAEQLNITQPTLSRQLAALEEELGAKLFNRGGHQITLTNEGLLLKRRALEIVDLEDKIVSEFKGNNDSIEGKITIGCGEFLAVESLAKICKNYREKYPLVQFIHDAGACGKDTRLALAQGRGALVWASPEVQKEHPCFVFAPQFDGPPIVDDDWNVDERLEDAKAALDNILELYSIDRNRIYTTGQSMGCMASIVLNIRYPEYFAASYLVAGQWDERNIPGLEKQKLWMLCSQGDAKAFPTMNQMCVNMERAGARVARRVINAGLSQEDYTKIADEIMKEKPDIIFTPYNLETVADGWHSNGGEHHVSTWQTAYDVKVIRDWLFAQSREE